jgi:hypothetical protein
MVYFRRSGTVDSSVYNQYGYKKKDSKGFGRARTAALLICACPNVPQESKMGISNIKP